MQRLNADNSIVNTVLPIQTSRKLSTNLRHRCHYLGQDHMTLGNTTRLEVEALQSASWNLVLFALLLLPH